MVAQGKIHIIFEKVWFVQLRTIVYFRKKSLLQNVTDFFKLFQIVTNATGCSKYLNIFMSFNNVLMQQISDRFSKSQKFKIENSKIWSRETVSSHRNDSIYSMWYECNRNHNLFLNFLFDSFWRSDKLSSRTVNLSEF